MLCLFLAAQLAAVDSAVISRPIRAPAPEGHVLAGTLFLGADTGRRHTVILLSGAGPQTRAYSTDTGGENGNGAFALLARRLVTEGYAVAVYDERGVGASTGDYDATATTATLTDDVHTIITALSDHRDVVGDTLILVGHSEGAAIAFLVASQDARVQGIVGLGTPAWAGARTIAWQREYATSHPGGVTPEERAARFDREHDRRAAGDVWYQHFLAFDPLEVAREITAIPVLLMHGANDEWVAVEQAQLLEETLRRAGSDRVRLMILPGHGHALSQSLEYSQRPFSGTALNAIAEWITAEFPTEGRAARAP